MNDIIGLIEDKQSKISQRIAQLRENLSIAVEDENWQDMATIQQELLELLGVRTGLVTAKNMVKTAIENNIKNPYDVLFQKCGLPPLEDLSVEQLMAVETALCNLTESS